MSETALRLLIFVAVFVLVALCEHAWPRRPRRQTRARRWGINLGLLGIDILAQRLTLGAAALGMALYAQAQGWGLFNVQSLPVWLTAVAGFLLLDLAIYLQHRLFHVVPLFWRLHLVHHTDLDLDLSSGFRFHPLEILLSLLYKVALVAVLGISPLVVLVFEATLSAAALFNHANLRLPLRLDAWLRWLLVTPDMHRVHHSVIPAETNSNYGFFISLWDRLLGSYREQPSAGHQGMTIGLHEYQREDRLGLMQLVLIPFRAPESEVSNPARSEDRR
ncbi:sterol desaturase family protein [Marinobacterium rhizophilum]|uniref:Sterol desaturase family protein n=1 Tax=Marinobacterium rhizophilum TaxID=420402 RepID=A0ABY5HNA4_9GAMM|nr:sterol desaturase family protein [Marinobacterium rhizophilum]UTW13917.1 sterol desaturase family protein [Marinobacterium rhizophilum]